ncbi:MAG: efflux RND transporter permease subunit, partial [Terriglobales bacterium]
MTNVVSQVGSPDDGTDPNNYSNIEFLVDLVPEEQWMAKYHSKEALVAILDKRLKAEMPGLIYNFSQYIKDNMDEAIAGAKSEFCCKLYGADLHVLTDVGTQIMNQVAKVPGMADVAEDQLLGQPQLMVEIDRAASARYGINSNDILDVVETSLGGKSITEVIEGERRFNLILRFEQGFRDRPDKLADILVTTPAGQTIPLSMLASIKEEHGASAIFRDHNARVIAIKANIRGRDLGSTVTEAQRNIAHNVKIPPGYHIIYSGQFDRAQEALGRLAVVVPLTLLLIFFLLYTAFGSAASAALVMCCVPLAAASGVYALFLTGTHFSISAGVGFIALFGVVIQNGVILIAKIKELVAIGESKRNAVLAGARIRVRPIMTASLVALAGLIPAATCTGIGSQSQRPFAIVIAGGILPATILTLIVLPALFELFHRDRPDA